MKLHRKIKHNEKVCHPQELGSHIQGQGHNQGSELKSGTCDYLKLAKANFVKLHKIEGMSRIIVIFLLKVKVTFRGQS